MQYTKLPSLFPTSKELDSLMNELFGKSYTGDKYPATNLYKDGDDKYHIEIAVTGFRKEELDISLDKDTLVVTAIKETEELEETKDYMYRGIAKRNFTRSFKVHDIDTVDATVEDGILHIVLTPLVPEVTKKTILIN